MQLLATSVADTRAERLNVDTEQVSCSTYDLSEDPLLQLKLGSRGRLL